ncbi:allantoate amidohydrolase [Naumannella halotolerans]|uniref:N-carbamoyl-L-amino-acid hydrolase n=1 Tax=Naumannella halotolerans TaxID=993414 RepID=A0A4R7IYU3_9ACTN|nr:allantoate amidohydrolase [Naumannella halotolerans]TDT29874.1 N-carbamoyl-L-amino-acid hydrolase [Naumannella halotolerans]
MTFQPLAEIADIGRDRELGGWSRHLLDPADRALREWFVGRAQELGLQTEVDVNANIWAWWGEPGPDSVVTGSHLDSVPGGGAFDGPLGVVSALEAVGRLRSTGFVPRRPLAVVAMAEEEGSRFSVACLGSKLLSGALPAERALGLRDRDGFSLAETLDRAGLAPERAGRDPGALSRIGLFVELHVEQGRGLVELDSPVGLASNILGHGRWRVVFDGEGNHAGATRMQDRRDPMVAAAATVAAIPAVAMAHPGSRATVGRVRAVPGGTNVIASRVEVFLDARAEEDLLTRRLVHEITELAAARAAENGCSSRLVEDSWLPTVHFDPAVREGLADALAPGFGTVPVLPTGAGHDAGVLSEYVPTAMIFVRNPSGVSHAPAEWASAEDCWAGVDALTAVLTAHLAAR